MAQYLARLAIDRNVVQHMRANFVIIELVVRSILEIPDDLASVGIDSECRIGVEIVSRSVFGIEHGRRLTGAPICQVGGRIVGPSIPESTAAGLPRVMIVRPSLVARFPRARYSVETPQYLASLGVDCHQPTAPSDIGPASGNNDHVLNDQRRASEGVGIGDTVDLVPQDLAGIPVR